MAPVWDPSHLLPVAVLLARLDGQTMQWTAIVSKSVYSVIGHHKIAGAPMIMLLLP